MKTYLLAACAAILSFQTFAQDTTASIKTSGTLNYWEPEGKDKQTRLHLRELRTTKIFIQLDLTEGGVFNKTLNTTYFVTKLSQTEPESIMLSSIECKLYPYYPHVFGMKLLIYQVRKGDTLREVIPILHKERNMLDGITKIRVRERNIKLEPGDFYIGFGFVPGELEDPVQYRMYANDKGSGAIISLPNEGGVKITEAPGMPYIFPFKINYRKS